MDDKGRKPYIGPTIGTFDDYNNDDEPIRRVIGKKGKQFFIKLLDTRWVCTQKGSKIQILRYQGKSKFPTCSRNIINEYTGSFIDDELESIFGFLMKYIE